MNLRDGRVKDWFYLENELVERVDLSNYEKLVYMVIARFVNDKQQAFPSYKTIAKKSGIGRTTAIKAVNGLISKGLLKKKIRRKKNQLENDTNLYTLLSAKAAISYKNLINGDLGGSISDEPPSTRDEPPSIPGDQEQYLNNNTKISINKNICEDKAYKDVFDYWNNLILKSELMKKGKKYTEEAEKIIAARIKEHGSENLKKMLDKLSKNAHYLGDNDSQTVYFCKIKTVFNKSKCTDRIELLDVQPVEKKSKNMQKGNGKKNGFHNFQQRISKNYNNKTLEPIIDRNNQEKRASTEEHREAAISDYGSIENCIKFYIDKYGENHAMVAVKKKQLNID